MVLSTNRGDGNVLKFIAISLMCAGMLLTVGCAGNEELLQQQQQQISDQQKQMEEARTENTSLRQRIVKLEQDNRNLEARLSEAEGKVMMERDRADKAEADLAEAMKPKTKTKTRMPAEMPNVTPDMPVGYAEAWTAYGAHNYDDGIAKFEALLSGGVATNWADNCHYWIGECNYGKKQYAEAVKHFEMVMGYAGSEKMADAHFMMAQSYDRLGDKAKAKEHYETVVKDFPTSAKGELAKLRAAKM